MSQQINLFNPVFTRQGKYFSTVMMLQGLGVLALVSALGCGWLYHQTGQAQARFDAAKLQHDKLNPPSDANRQTKAQLIKERDELLAASKQGSGEFSGHLHALARHTLDGVWLTHFSLKGCECEHPELKLSGQALYPELVTDYLQQLGQTPQFRGAKVELPGLRKQEGAGQHPMAFELTLNGKAGAK